MGKNISIIDKACENWNEKLDHRVETFNFRKSFSRISMFDDIYLRYIQFRTLHRRFFTNNLLHKMKIKDSPTCAFCLKEEDSNEHMLIECENVQKLCHEVESWIAEVGVIQYFINENIIIFGEKKVHWLNAVILINKKIIFNAKTNLSTSNIECIKRQVKLLLNYERQKYTFLGREDKLEKRLSMLIDYYDE